MILAADVGGTKILFGCFEVQDDKMLLTFKRRYQSSQFSSLEEAIKTFLNDFKEKNHEEKFAAACFSLAGPIVDGRCHLTNLGWQVDLQELIARFPKIKKITIRNDLEALGMGISHLNQKDVVSLFPHIDANARKEKKPYGILSLGTGLGQAFVFGDQVHPSEGGHCDFGPRSEEQVRLWRFLHEKFGHVSYERILSGDGICQLVQFQMKERGLTTPGFPLTPEMVTKRALAGNCELSGKAMELFAGVLGAEVGNFVLKIMTLQEIYLGGGITPYILPWLQGEAFRNAFHDKGRSAYIMKRIPIYAILDRDVPLYGSGILAAIEAGLSPNFVLDHNEKPGQ